MSEIGILNLISPIKNHPKPHSSVSTPPFLCVATTTSVLQTLFFLCVTPFFVCYNPSFFRLNPQFCVCCNPPIFVCCNHHFCVVNPLFCVL
jgi:hypothetical protein